MKDQYVGDKTDYLKYALLRALQKVHGGPLVVTWMRTPNDGKTDGGNIGYLCEPEKFEKTDPKLFDVLRRLVDGKKRAVRSIKTTKILARHSKAIFIEDQLNDDKDERATYFDLVEKEAPPGAMVFLDPDNGTEVKSVKLGNKRSSKYVYWDEIKTLGRNRTLVIFQHWRMGESREKTAAKAREELSKHLPKHSIFDLRGSQAFFLVATKPALVESMTTAARRVAAAWPVGPVVDPR